MNFAMFCLAVVGMTNILCDSTIFAPLREWVEEGAIEVENKLAVRSMISLDEWLKDRAFVFVNGVLGCHQCCGTWCGFFLSASLISTEWSWVFAGGCAGSLLASFYRLLAELILAKTDFNLTLPGDGDA